MILRQEGPKQADQRQQIEDQENLGQVAQMRQACVQEGPRRASPEAKGEGSGKKGSE